MGNAGPSLEDVICHKSPKCSICAGGRAKDFLTAVTKSINKLRSLLIIKYFL